MILNSTNQYLLKNAGNCDPKLETQRTAEWFNARKGKSMEGIRLQKLLDGMGKRP